MRRLTILVAAFALIAAACGDDDAATTTTTTSETTTTTTAETTTTAPPTSPAEVEFEAQESDGSSIVVASVTLPAPGFIAVHGNADGSPGPVVGNSDLLPAGTSTDVEVVLDEPLTETDLLFPMAHIDANGNGEYEFFPPETTVDGPAMTADGEVAVVGAEVTVVPSAASIEFEAQESDGSSIVVASVTLPAPGFIAVHGNADGSPGPVVGNSDLLPAGTSTDVEVVLDEPLTETDLLFPMAHIDANGNGEYEFFPPETTVDGPAMTAEGEVAVVGAEVTVVG